MMNSKSKQRSKPSGVLFFGRGFTQETALDEVYKVVDFFEAMKKGKSDQAEKPHPDLSYLIRCNRVAIEYHTKINLKLTGISYKKNYLTEDQVILVWMVAHKSKEQGRVISLSRNEIHIKDNYV